jgi:hypothetical protein
MPGLQEYFSMLAHEPSHFVQLMLFKTPVLGQRNRVEPKFGNLPITLHMDVRRLTVVGAKKR